MLALGIWIVWQAASELKGMTRRDLSFLEAMKYPLVYIVTVWFAPAIVSLLSGLSSLGTGKLVLRFSLHLRLMGVVVPRALEGGRSLADLLVSKGVLTREEMQAALNECSPNGLLERLAALQLTLGEALSQKWSRSVDRRLDKMFSASVPKPD